jgi:tryptophanyl-tRNA synthetase
MLIRVAFHFMQCTVYRKKKHIQVQSTIVPLTELTWQLLDYMRYSKLKKKYIFKTSRQFG